MRNLFFFIEINDSFQLLLTLVSTTGSLLTAFSLTPLTPHSEAFLVL